MKKLLPLILASIALSTAAIAQDKDVKIGNKSEEATKVDVTEKVIEKTTEKASEIHENPCKMQQDVSLSVNFNMSISSYAEAQKKFDEKMLQINDFAKRQNIKKFDLQSQNFSVSNQQNGYGNDGFSMSGNIGYQLASSDEAFKLAEFMSQQHMQVNVSVNKYRGGCPTMDTVGE